MLEFTKKTKETDLLKRLIEDPPNSKCNDCGISTSK